VKSLLYRRATIDERAQVDKLVRRCGPDVRDYFDMRNLDEYWQSGEVWVAAFANTPVAFAVVHPLKREPVQSLYDIGVHPAWRRLGIAKGLLQAALSAHPSKPRLRLVVSDDNLEAQGFYKSLNLSFGGAKLTRRNGTVFRYEGEPQWS
jgi:ribosomal protein S18 acetylase RimI-like enzyme